MAGETKRREAMSNEVSRDRLDKILNELGDLKQQFDKRHSSTRNEMDKDAAHQLKIAKQAVEHVITILDSE
jgi:hypothetical protein